MSKLQRFPNTGPTELVWELARAFKQFAARPALTVGAQCWTYADLWQNAASVAGSLASSHHRVALIGSRSIEDYAAVLATFLSGRCYVPLNAHTQVSELRSFLDLTQASTLLSARETPIFSSLRQSGSLDAHLIDITRPTSAMPPPRHGKFAYIIGTSGSSGAPKAVPISHRNLLSYLANVRRHLDITPRDRTSQIFDLSFDLSLHDIFMTWLNGAHLHAPQQEDAQDLLEFAERHRLTVWFSTPSHARKALLRSSVTSRLKDLRLSMFCGEPLTWGLAHNWARRTNGRLENWYGPTEATIAATRYVLPDPRLRNPGDIVPIGKTLAPFMHAVSQRGELCLRGPQVFQGYLKSQKPRRGFYRTGDVVAQDASGNLLFQRRKEGQIKFKGQNVDLHWVESKIAETTGVQTTVLPWPFGMPDPESLIAVVAQSGPVPDRLKNHIKKTLPARLCLQLISVPDMPLTTAGKRDLGALARRIEGPLARQGRRPVKLYDRLVGFACDAQPGTTQNDIEQAENLMEAGLDSLALTAFIARLETELELSFTQNDVARLSHMSLRQILHFTRRARAEGANYVAADPALPDPELRNKPHYRAMRALDFLENFPLFLDTCERDILPLIGSSGFMRGIDTRALDATLETAGHIVRSANIGMAMLSNQGICELCAFVADQAAQRRLRFPISVLELELLQLSVLPPAGDIEVIDDYQSGRLSGATRKTYDPDTLWDMPLAGSLTEHQGPWRPRDAPARWESKRHEEIRKIYQGQVAFDPDALAIWRSAIAHLQSVSAGVAVVLHPLDGHTSRLHDGHGHLSDITARLSAMPDVQVIRDDQFALGAHQFRNFCHLNARDGRQGFSVQLAQHLGPILDKRPP